MKEKSKNHVKNVLFSNLRVLISIAFMAVMSILFGKFLAIPVGNVLRFSFENTPIIFMSVAFGPVAGMATGIVADLVGCLMVGYEINPIVTLGAALIGLVSGLSYKLFKRLPNSLKIFLSVLFAHIIGSVLIKTYGLSAFYKMPFMVLMLWRMLNYVIVGALDFAVIYYLLKNKALMRQIDKLKGNNGKKQL